MEERHTKTWVAALGSHRGTGCYFQLACRLFFIVLVAVQVLDVCNNLEAANKGRVDVWDSCKQLQHLQGGVKSSDKEMPSVTFCRRKNLLLCLRRCSSRSCRWPRLWRPPCHSRTPAAQTILPGRWPTAVPRQSSWCLLRCTCCWGTRSRAGPASHTGYGGWISCGRRRSSLLGCFDRNRWRAGSCCAPEK